MRPAYRVALHISDLHLTLTPPVARCEEDNWLETQRAYIDQIWELSFEPSIIGSLPVICSGDIFDRPKVSPELINFALEHLPPMYAVPGNHDLLHHNYRDIKKTAYWTLVEAGKVHNLIPNYPEEKNGLRLHAFPWGYKVRELEEPSHLLLEVAVVHDFIWTKKTGFPGAPPEKRLKPYKRKLRGYDIALFGDNHKSLGWNLNKRTDAVTIFNPGGFMRRARDQKDHRPCVGVIYSDGTIRPHFLDVFKDKLTEREPVQSDTIEKIISLLGNVIAIGDAKISFREAILRALDRELVDKEVRKIVLKALEDSGSDN